MQELEVRAGRSEESLLVFPLFKINKVFSPDVLQKKLLVSKTSIDDVTEEKNKYSQLFEDVKGAALQNEAKVRSSWIVHVASSSSGHCWSVICTCSS